MKLHYQEFHPGLRSYHSLPQRPCSIWSTARIGTSLQVQFCNHAQSALWSIRSLSQSDCQTWLLACPQWQEVCELKTSSVGPSQRSRFLVLTKKSTAYGNKNGSPAKWPAMRTILPVGLFRMPWAPFEHFLSLKHYFAFWALLSTFLHFGQHLSNISHFKQILSNICLVKHFKAKTVCHSQRESCSRS